MDLLIAVLAGLFGLGGVMYGRRLDRAHWLRDRRLQAYSTFLAEVDRSIREVTEWSSRYQEGPQTGAPPPDLMAAGVEAVTRLIRAGVEVDLLADRAVDLAREQVMDELVTAWVKVHLDPGLALMTINGRGAFERAARRALTR